MANQSEIELMREEYRDNYLWVLYEMISEVKFLHKKLYEKLGNPYCETA